MTRYYDNTRLSAYKKCPRSFYFRHVRHWRGDGISIPLAFGLAWHDAMDVVWKQIAWKKNKDDMHVTKLALARFEQTWIEQGLRPLSDATPEDFAHWRQRNPGVAGEMLYEYIIKRRKFIEECELLAFERPFVVPIFPDDDSILYIGRMDKDVRHQGCRRPIEHKTTAMYSKDEVFRRDYVESWTMDAQCEGYAYTMRMLHPTEKPRGPWVDAALVHKTIHDGFKFIPADKSPELLHAWLVDVRQWVEEIDKDLARLNECRQEANTSGQMPSHLAAFRRDDQSCFGKYGRCSYYDICRTVPNPEKLREPPGGYITEKWEPFEILGLSKLGLPEEEEI